ncbi:hypothetical protein BDY19DRAFT_881048 [Irpex rosettiformis]|uniref:Uncharacterized protein n=1 Tax=Irpex rosettiformis TaxID=378272 RepID=A0ACB8UL09_9APHY|nr:hypothetical protein BDY19DRAFT_881048 [Irpex rosettiformis]
MQSLRTRKPSQASRPNRQKTQKLPKQDGTSVQARRATRVDDKIKKRMSMRYADISSPTNVSIPALPTIPLGLRPGGFDTREPSSFLGEDEGPRGRRDEESKEEQRKADLRMLDQDRFDPDIFLKSKMANSTEAELRTLQSSLHDLKDDVATDLRRNVFKNYAEFVVVSKDISTLENEMLEFKDALSEWKGMPSLLHIDDSASVAERRRNVRSSIADLKVLYANQMQTLHTQIEGSSKFVPTTPGRHVIMEMDNISSLNPATYKVDHAIRFILLDDAVLVARKRRRRNNAESDKLVAERCWPLNEMLVLDTKDTATMTNVFKIRYNKETHVYRTEVSGDKRSLLMQFRSVAEELAAKRRKEREGEHQRRKSMWGGGGGGGDRASNAFPPEMPLLPDFLAGLGDKPDAKEKAERDARWISDFSDDLTVAIALRRFDDAVALVQEGESKAPSMPILAAKLTPLKTSLTSSLLQSLALPSNRKSNIVHLIGLISQLGAGAAARSTFLNSRAEMMRKRVRMITFEGDIVSYIGDLATVIFTAIKHTADWFLASFKENEVSSSFVQWAKTEVEKYAEMFRKQVYSLDVDPEVIDSAVKVTKLQSRKLLEEYGLDFRFLLDQVLVEKLEVSSSPKPPAYKPHAQTQGYHDPIRTPASTPRSHSPAPTLAAPTPQRTVRSPPVPPIPIVALSVNSLSQPPIPSPGNTPYPRPGTNSPASTNRSYSPLPSTPPPMPTALASSRSGTPDTPRRALPPRSSNRPGSSTPNRPPPVAIPRRENMF